LAAGCQQHWAVAVALLQRGELETFLQRLGRADLALAARQAARFPDKDRGLDQFLGRLPGNGVAPPALVVEPLELNLGTLKPGENKRGVLTLINGGKRLLYGSVTVVGCPWLTIGNQPGSRHKLFQFGGDWQLPLNVRGQQLRASSKPLTGRLVVESNGGSCEIPLRALVPVRPYPAGCLAGALSPRQLAEKAKANPQAAALLFQKGQVARWYQDNGWVYPVQGPAASGLGAVQQFFEALGLAPPPRVSVSAQRLDLKGEPGSAQEARLEIRTEEKRPVYAHASSDQPWLEVGRPLLNGRLATVPLRVAAVPDRQGETLQATVTVTANGNQRFRIPVFLKIGTGLAFLVPAGGVVATAARPRPASKLHLLPLVLLMSCLFLVFLWDCLRLGPQVIADGPFGPRGPSSLELKRPPDEPLDYINRINVLFSDQQRFGISCPRLTDPRNPDKPKLLTRDERGITNNTCVRIEGYEYLYGTEIPGVRYVRERGKVQKQLPHPDPAKKGRCWYSVWESEYGRIRVRQEVEIVVGEMTRLYDTAVIKYQITNRDGTPHTVGLRVLLDTLIGANDGVPFYIPPTVDKPARFVSTQEVFGQKDIPEFIQALETGDLTDPNGTVAVVGLKLRGFEPLEKMAICRWPSDHGGGEARWGGGAANKAGDWPFEPLDKNPNARDSALALYWAQLTMKPGEQRDLAFTYGLGRVVSDLNDVTREDRTDGRMRLYCIKASTRKPFSVTAYIKTTDPSQTVRILLPEGLRLAPGERAEKPVPAGTREGYAQVTWRLQAAKWGEYEVKADAPGIGVASIVIRVREECFLDGD